MFSRSLQELFFLRVAPASFEAGSSKGASGRSWLLFLRSAAPQVQAGAFHRTRMRPPQANTSVALSNILQKQGKGGAPLAVRFQFCAFVFRAFSSPRFSPHPAYGVLPARPLKASPEPAGSQRRLHARSKNVTDLTEGRASRASKLAA